MVTSSDPDPLDTESRREAAAEHEAMPDGSFPVRDRQELERAIHSVGRARHNDPEAVRHFIMRRARELGATDLIPESWK
jgi:hypothetical protein